MLGLLMLGSAAAAPAAPMPAAVKHSGSEYTLTNVSGYPALKPPDSPPHPSAAAAGWADRRPCAQGYVSVTFAEKLGGGGAISSLKGDFEGQGAYGEELLAGSGYTLEVQGPDGALLHSSAEAQDEALSVKVVSSGPTTAAILVEGLSAGGATESWALTLAAGARGFSLNATGTATAALGPGAVAQHALLATPLSVYGYYPADGVVQMMNAKPGKTHLPSARGLGRVYMMGGVNPSNTHPKPSDGTQGAIDIQRASATPGQVHTAACGRSFSVGCVFTPIPCPAAVAR